MNDDYYGYGYPSALKAAGAEILAYEAFGDYQGSWFALVLYEGKKQWISGEYGSCSGCDHFEAAFDYGERNDPEKLAAFGKEYLTDPITTEAVLKIANDTSRYDIEGDEMVTWVQKVIAEHGV